MFTGIVEELGEVVSLEGGRLRVAARAVLTDVVLGASIAVNGCCLTAVAWATGDGADESDRTVDGCGRCADRAVLRKGRTA